jgi:beta-glucosidase
MNILNAIDKSTAFPAPIALAATWNRQLSYDYAMSIGEECRAAGIPVLLGPGMNIYRVSQCGRNFEYFGEDPYLSGQMVSNYVRGVQSTGVIATLKHFVGNNTDFFRRKSNSVIDERTIHEIYTPAFKAGIDAGAHAVMTSYNLLNGEWCGQSEYVINQLLKKELGFNWLVMTDWWSVYDGEKLIKSGQHIEMPSSLATKDAKKLLDEGKITEEQMNDMVRHLLATYISMGSFNIKPDLSFVSKFSEHEKVALNTEREAIVLLQNNGVLPIKMSNKKILATGFYLDEILRGGGSAEVDGYNHKTLRSALSDEFGDAITYDLNPSDKVIKSAKAVILSIGTKDSEGYDRPFELADDEEKLIMRIVSLNPNTIVVVNSGSGIKMTNWQPKAGAILYGWYPGQNGHQAMAEIISGKINPSGKLPMTIEKDFNQTPGFGYMQGEPFYKGWNSEGENAHAVYDVKYKEGILVGYRWFDTKSIEPLFPFGHGLSYTTFSYSNLAIRKVNDQVEVTFIITNKGKTEGAEVVQLYVNDEACSVLRPAKELKAFDKIKLAAGESKSISFQLRSKDFSFYDEVKKQWILEAGKFNILVGASSRDIKLQQSVDL